MTIDVFEELKDLIMASKLPLAYLARESGVGYITILKWLNGPVRQPRIDTMLKVAKVVGKQIELTANVRKLVSHYEPKRGLSRHAVRMTLMRL